MQVLLVCPNQQKKDKNEAKMKSNIPASAWNQRQRQRGSKEEYKTNYAEKALATARLGNLFSQAYVGNHGITGYRDDGTYGFKEDYLEQIGAAVAAFDRVKADPTKLGRQMDVFIKKVKAMKDVTGKDFSDVMAEAEQIYNKRKKKNEEARMKAHIPASAWNQRQRQRGNR